MSWYKAVVDKLRQSGIFKDVRIIGVKIRASIDETTFLDMYYDPTTHNYSYALIDLKLTYPGDKRVFGWDDYPHEGVKEIENLRSYPHHFQIRKKDGTWLFKESNIRGNIEIEVDIIVRMIKKYMCKDKNMTNLF